MVTQALIVNGQPRYGRFEQIPGQINWQDFAAQTPFGQPVTGLRKRLGFKQFMFIGLTGPEAMIGVALADLAWGQHAFFYIKPHAQAEGEAVSLTLPTGLQRIGMGLQAQPLEAAHWKGLGLEVRLSAAHAAVRTLEVLQKGQLRLQVSLQIGQVQPLSLCSPTGATGWTYTQKYTTVPVSGFWVDGQGQRHVLGPDWLGSTDDSCGFLRRETAWHWLSLSGQLADGTRLGLNLAQGVNDSFGTENALWINGQVYELPPVLFTALGEDRWAMRSADGQVMLEGQTGWCRRESLNLGVVGSHFHQWVSQVSGQVVVEGHCYTLHQLPALIEHHFARW